MLNRFDLISFGEGCFSQDNAIMDLYEKYCISIGLYPRNNVWIDKVEKKLFSLDLTYKNNNDYASTLYLSSEESFLEDQRHGLPYFEKTISKHYNFSKLETNNNSIIETCNRNAQYKDSTILIIGAGPSTDLANIDKIERDYTWVCNDFLNHETLKNINASLFYMSNHAYLRKREMEYFVQNKDVSVCFDINVQRDYNVISRYKNIDPTRVFIFSTRLFTTNGVVLRLAELACLLGAKTIKLIGADGHTEEHFKNGKSLTSFERTKDKNIPSGQSYGSQCREYILFWEHMKTVRQNVKIENLGFIYPENISDKILNFLSMW